MNRRIPRSPDDVEQALLTAISDPIRHKIILHLARGPMSVGALASRFPVVRAAVSRHLKVLLQAGLVSARRSGPLNIYALQPQPLERLQLHLGRIAFRAADAAEGGWRDAA